jgi:hypothetical protein
MGKINKFISVFIVILGFFIIASYTKLYVQTTPPYVGLGRFEKNYIAVPSHKPANTMVSYKGETGKTALDILIFREKARVEQDNSGMVSAINGRKADTSKKEFWAFYVNGKMSTVGAQEYMSKESDTIVWKIETY